MCAETEVRALLRVFVAADSCRGNLLSRLKGYPKNRACVLSHTRSALSQIAYPESDKTSSINARRSVLTLPSRALFCAVYPIASIIYGKWCRKQVLRSGG